MRHIRLPFQIPYTAQIASPDLAQAIFQDGMDPALDPRWTETGAASAAEYAYWSDRCCGIACVKMCVEALGGESRPIMDWVRAGLACGGYLITTDDNGQKMERGWVHRALADLIHSAGFYAEPCAASTDDLARALMAGQLVIASVSYELGTELPITRRSGHLVIVCGADVGENDAIDCFYLHNPSGRRADLRVNARISIKRFTEAYSGRAILVGSPASDPGRIGLHPSD